MLHDLRARQEASSGPQTLKQIAARIHKNRCDAYRRGAAPTPPGKPPGIATLWGVFNGARTSPGLVYDLVLALGGSPQRGQYAQTLVEATRESQASPPRRKSAAAEGTFGSVTDAILARLPPDPSRGTVPADKDKLRLAIEIALGRAVIKYAWSNAMTGLAVPLLRPEGLLAGPAVAEILAAALTGRGTDPRTFGAAWAEAFLAGTRIRDLTQDASEFIGYVRDEGGKLKPLRRLWPAHGPDTPGPARTADANQSGDEAIGGGKTSVNALRQAATTVRAELADVTRMLPSGTAIRNLPPLVRVNLYDQTELMAQATRGFTGREFVFKPLTEFIEQKRVGYCFVKAYAGVGKTALLSSFAAAHPEYARHFNVLSGDVTSPAAFLKNICAQLISAYGLPFDDLPDRATYNNAFLVELLERAARAARGRQVVIMVDALDEAEPPRLSGVNRLDLPSSLPDGCRFIVTVRKNADGWAPRLDPGCWTAEVDINERGDDNMNDILAYITSRRDQQGIKGYLWSRGLSIEDFAGTLAEKSEGNFMYLRHVLPEYEKGGSLIEGELAELPEGLVRYYEQQVARMRGADEDAWFTLRLPVLTKLAQARRPLTLAEITVKAGQHDANRVRSVLREWLQFLVKAPVTRDGSERDGYRIFHASFKEFLLDLTSEAAQAECDLRGLGDELWDRYRDDWDDADG